MPRVYVGFSMAAVITACATAPSADVSGTWGWEESFSVAAGLSCQAAGELLLAQFADNNRFTGQRARSGTCTDAPAGFMIDGAQILIGAEIQGSDVTFEIDFCNYDGVLTTDNEMSGTLVCPDGVGQVQDVIEGTWRATR